MGSCDGHTLSALWFEGQRHSPRITEGMIHSPGLPIFGKAVRWLDRYFAGENPAIDFDMRPQGTSFQQAVWAELRGIVHGTTTTYGAVAAAVGCRSARAVGQAVGHNPIAIIIPCHRVLACGGRPGGYAGGPERKAALLALEQTLP